MWSQSDPILDPVGAGAVPACHGCCASMESEDHFGKMGFYFPSLLNTGITVT